MAFLIDAQLASSPASKLIDGIQLPLTSVTSGTKINRLTSLPVSGTIILKDAVVKNNTSATTVSDYTNLLTIALSSPYTLVWVSSNLAVGSVDQTGYVTWVSNGSVNISATAGLMSFSFPLTLSTTVSTTNTFVNWVSGTLANQCTSAIDTSIASVSTYSGIQLYSSLTFSDTPSANAFIRNSGCWASGLSGITAIAVGYRGLPPGDTGTGTGITAIAPDICMTCQHSYQQPGSIIYFVQKDNTVVHRTVISQAQVGVTDINILRLDSPLPIGIEIMKFPPVNLLNYTPNYTFGIPIFCINGQMNPLVYDFNGIDNFTNNNIIVSNTPTEANRLNLWQILSANNPNYSNHLGGVPPGYGTPGVFYNNFGRFISGDSGHVSALIVNNELMILGTGWTGSGSAPAGWTQLSAINTVMANLSSSYQVTTYNLSAFPTY